MGFPKTFTIVTPTWPYWQADLTAPNLSQTIASGYSRQWYVSVAYSSSGPYLDTRLSLTGPDGTVTIVQAPATGTGLWYYTYNYAPGAGDITLAGSLSTDPGVFTIQEVGASGTIVTSIASGTQVAPNEKVTLTSVTAPEGFTVDSITFNGASATIGTLSCISGTNILKVTYVPVPPTRVAIRTSLVSLGANGCPKNFIDLGAGNILMQPHAHIWPEDGTEFDVGETVGVSVGTEAIYTRLVSVKIDGVEKITAGMNRATYVEYFPMPAHDVTVTAVAAADRLCYQIIPGATNVATEPTAVPVSPINPFWPVATVVPRYPEGTEETDPPWNLPEKPTPEKPGEGEPGPVVQITEYPVIPLPENPSTPGHEVGPGPGPKKPGKETPIIIPPGLDWYANAIFSLRWRDDMGPWKNERIINMTDFSAKDPDFTLNRLGIYHTRQWEIVSMSAWPCIAVYMEEDADVID